jgi:hypothetical protein
MRRLTIEFCQRSQGTADAVGERGGVETIHIADISSEGDVRQGANGSLPQSEAWRHLPKCPAPGTFVSLEDVVAACDAAVDCAEF